MRLPLLRECDENGKRGDKKNSHPEGKQKRGRHKEEMVRHLQAAVFHREREESYAAQGLGHKAVRHRARAAWHMAAHKARMLGFGAQPRGSEAANATEIAKYISDPVSLSLFVDPVVASNGYTHERYTIECVLRKKRECPNTREKITSHLIPDKSMKSVVEGFVATYGSREGEEWMQVRELCDEYVKARHFRELELPRLPPNDQYEYGAAGRYLRTRMFHDQLMEGREQKVEMLLINLGLFHDRELYVTRSELDAAYEEDVLYAMCHAT